MVCIDKNDCAEKLLHPRRFNGTCYLKKRHFVKKIQNDKKPIWSYDGHLLVPITKMTPIQFEYKCNVKRLSVTFYVQQYNVDNFPIDITLQKILNE